MLYLIRQICFISLLTLFASPSSANEIQQKSTNIEDEIGGLMTDRTLTRFGKIFYQSFSASWRTIRGAQKYSLNFIEAPLPQSGTVLWVEYKDKKIYRTYFGRRQNLQHDKLIEQAIQQVINALTSMASEQINPDLVGDGYE
jgi:curli production assembly/transport component CsgE